VRFALQILLIRFTIAGNSMTWLRNLKRGPKACLLVVAPEKLPDALPLFRKVVAGCSYQPGQTCAEYRAGERVANYGLGALVIGGAAVEEAAPGWLACKPILLALVILVPLAAVAASVRGRFLPRTRHP
jgi:uncharacterized membrane-anchored protein